MPPLDGLGDFIRRTGVIGVVIFLASGERHMHDVMEVISPCRVEPVSAGFRATNKTGIVLCVLCDDDDGTIACGFSGGLGKFLENVGSAIVLDGIGRIEAETVKVILPDPHACVINHEISYPPSVWAVVIDGIAPGRRVVIGKIILAKRSQIVAIGSEMVVD